MQLNIKNQSKLNLLLKSKIKIAKSIYMFFNLHDLGAFLNLWFPEIHKESIKKFIKAIK